MSGGGRVSAESEILERCGSIARAIDGHGDLDEAVADLRLLPAHLPIRGALAAGLVTAVIRSGPEVKPERIRHLRDLLEIADRDPPQRPEWPRHRAVALGYTLVQGGLDGEVADPGAALAEWDAVVAEVGADPATAVVFESIRAALVTRLALTVGDEATLQRMPAIAKDLGDRMRSVSTRPEAETFAQALPEVMSLLSTQRHDGDVAGALDRLQTLVERLPPGHHLREVVDQTAVMLGPFRDMMGADPDRPGTRPTDEQLAVLAEAARQPDLRPAERAVRHGMVGGAALRLGAETDPHRVELAIEHLREAVALSGPDEPNRVAHLFGLALALFRRGELTGAVKDVDEVASLLEEARSLAGGPGHHLWAGINEMLSGVRRRRGGAAVRETGRPGATAPGGIALEALREYAWRVLAQSDLAAANLVVRDAARSAMDIARQCLSMDNDPGSAIRALDAGRGLALFAATETYNVAGRLEDAGHPALARRWRAASASGESGSLPTEMRREVLAALTRSGTASVLDPPTLGEIRGALATLDADALVYLVTGERHVPGYACIVPVSGPPSFMALPFLHSDKALDVERYLTALSRRDAALAGPARDLGPLEEEAAFEETLDSLCDWAWRAAIGPLVERYLPTLPRPASGRPHRLFLVPMGDLARVPWQAARRSDGTYALGHVAISQIASARMLCHSAALSPVPITPVGLVVGDPDTALAAPDLSAARLEAYAIRRSFYRGARYVGRLPDGSPSPSGAGSAEELRAWLTSTSPATGAMLHLACHGVVESGADNPTSYLLLAGGGRLSAGELVDLMARSPGRAVGLTVLAACRTGQAFSGYDEAYSLGTAFLAAGVRSVLSTQWSVPDVATSALMYMFHHHLMADGLPAWDALRRAQLWMLDRERTFPERMPASLRRHLVDVELGGVAAWAGFVHLGQ